MRTAASAKTSRSGPTRSACRSRARTPARRGCARARRRARRAGSRCRARVAPSRSVAASVAVSCAVEARRRLVEQQQPRLGHQRPADLDQPPDAEAERLDRPVGDRRRARAGRASPRARRARRRSAGPGPSRSFHSAPSPVAHPLGDEEVLARRHAGEQLDALERAADARAGPAGGSARAARSRPSKRHRAAVGLQDAEQAVEERGLARAVRADEPDDLARARRRGSRRRAR